MADGDGSGDSQAIDQSAVIASAAARLEEACRGLTACLRALPSIAKQRETALQLRVAALSAQVQLHDAVRMLDAGWASDPAGPLDSRRCRRLQRQLRRARDADGPLSIPETPDPPASPATRSPSTAAGADAAARPDSDADSEPADSAVGDTPAAALPAGLVKADAGLIIAKTEPLADAQDSEELIVKTEPGVAEDLEDGGAPPWENGLNADFGEEDGPRASSGDDDKDEPGFDEENPAVNGGNSPKTLAGKKDDEKSGSKDNDGVGASEDGEMPGIASAEGTPKSKALDSVTAEEQNERDRREMLASSEDEDDPPMDEDEPDNDRDKLLGSDQSDSDQEIGRLRRRKQSDDGESDQDRDLETRRSRRKKAVERLAASGQSDSDRDRKTRPSRRLKAAEKWGSSGESESEQETRLSRRKKASEKLTGSRQSDSDQGSSDIEFKRRQKDSKKEAEVKRGEDSSDREDKNGLEKVTQRDVHNVKKQAADDVKKGADSGSEPVDKRDSGSESDGKLRNSDSDSDGRHDGSRKLREKQRRSRRSRRRPAGPMEPTEACSVMLRRLPRRLERMASETGSVTIMSREKRQLSHEALQIRRLANIATLMRSTVTGDSDSSSESDAERCEKRTRRVKTEKGSGKQAKRRTLKDVSDGESGYDRPSGEDSGGGERSVTAPVVPLQENEFDRDQLLGSDSSLSGEASDKDDGTDFAPSDTEKRGKDKEKNKKEKKTVKKEAESGDDAGGSNAAKDDEKLEAEDGSGDLSDKEKLARKKLSTKVRGLLGGKLSATDSSEEDEKFRQKISLKKEKEAEAKVKQESNANSEEERDTEDELPKLVNLSSSDDDFVAKKTTPRRKRLRIANDSDSESDVCMLNSDGEEAGPSGAGKRPRSSSSAQTITSDSDSADDFKPPKNTRSRARLKRIRRMSDESASVSSDGSVEEVKKDSQGTPGKGGRKNIRHIKEAEQSTKEASQAETARKKRIEDKQAKLDEMLKEKGQENAKEAPERLVLDFDPETKETLVSVHKNFVKVLKPHQISGVKFMFDSTIETVARLMDDSNKDNSGCILAHCMGLGKTLQVIVLLHTLLESAGTRPKMSCALVVCPKNTVQNWVRELKQWQKRCRVPEVDVIDITFRKDNYERSFELEQWQTEGGVCVLSYDMYKRFVGTGGKKGYVKKQRDRFQKALVDPGPDIVVCDEGHLLKNPRTATFKSLHQMVCKRRIILTGTPLQNNLREYHTMVEFVKPRLLGSESEFSNRFVRPIENGSAVDAQSHDVRLMKRRSHVLHKLLDSVVQRRDYNVLTPFLPPKHEYTVLVRLSEVQRKLYNQYLEKARSTSTRKVLSDFQALSRVWTHPRTIQMKDERDELEDEMRSEREAMKKFVKNSSSSSDDEAEAENGAKEGEGEPAPTEEDWWRSCIPEDMQMDDPTLSGKLVLLHDLLIKCENIGDKLLVFSQSLFSLNLIEEHLARLHKEMQKAKSSGKKHPAHVYFGTWKEDYDYFRLDGSTPEDRRQLMCDRINKTSNERARLMLISTKAGGLGINLVGANRVVIFDASWNPTADSQAIFRVYRFGQLKPCYVYRFIAQGCMEEKIYDRQISKLSLSCRVVDERQVERHFTQHDVEELYEFEPDRKRTTGLTVPKDDLLMMELASEQSKWVSSVHGHDSLLQNLEDEELNEDEQRAAWEEYENDRRGVPKVNDVIPLVAGKAIDKQTVIEMIKKDNPTATEEQVQLMIPRAIQTLRAYYLKKQQQEQEQRRQYYVQMQQERQRLMAARNSATLQALQGQYKSGAGGAGLSNVDKHTYSQMLQMMATQMVPGQAGGGPSSGRSASSQLTARPVPAAAQPALRAAAQQAARAAPQTSRKGPATVALPKHLSVQRVQGGAAPKDKPSEPPTVVDIT